MKNNIPATTVFWYRHGTGFQAYRHEILYRQADQKNWFAGTKWKIIYRQPKCFGTGTEPDFKHTGMKFCTGKLINKFLFAGTKWKIIYRQLNYFCTGTEPDFKHTGMTFCTGKLIKNLHWPSPNETIIYWQPVCLCTGTVPNQWNIRARHVVPACLSRVGCAPHDVVGPGLVMVWQAREWLRANLHLCHDRAQ